MAERAALPPAISRAHLIQHNRLSFSTPKSAPLGRETESMMDDRSS